MPSFVQKRSFAFLVVGCLFWTPVLQAQQTASEVGTLRRQSPQPTPVGYWEGIGLAPKGTVTDTATPASAANLPTVLVDSLAPQLQSAQPTIAPVLVGVSAAVPIPQPQPSVRVTERPPMAGAIPQAAAALAQPPVQIPAFGDQSDIDWSRVLKLGDVVASEREALYRRTVASLKYDQVPVSELIRELANRSGIEYMIATIEDKPVSVNFRRNPFRALEDVVDNLGMGLVKKNDMWLITSVDKTKLIPRSYRFKHIHLDREFSFRESSGTRDQTGAPTFQPAQPMAPGGGAGSALSGTYEKVTNRANTQPPRSAADRSRDNWVLDRIQSILDSGLDALEPGKGALRDKPTPVVDAPPPFYDPDMNTLSVVTTDQKWMWIESFLNDLDQETYNIWVELRFVTTAKNNKSQKGINWAGGNRGGFGNGIAINLQGQAAPSNDTGGISGGLGNNGGADSSASGADIVFGPLNNLMTPTAILSASALQAQLHFYATSGTGRTSKVASFIAENNREVVYNLTQNRPVAVPSSTTNNTSGGAIVSSGSNVSNEEVGIVVRVLPQTVRDGLVRMNTQVEITNIVGGVVINSIEYPVIQRSAVNSSPKIQAAYTVELGGLEQMITSKTREKIPLLGDIPLLGLPFQEVVKNADVTSLALLVTVRLLDEAGNEVTFENGQKVVTPRNGPRIKTVDELMASANSRAL